ncbi:MFS transporter [Duganella sp. LjRoot269]|uniref:MFS transporter n=1 Tax=Duganella sp. LjRoot269 TaxID=3342305 RepID=UPI003ED06F39
MNTYLGIPRAAPDGMAARILLSFLATAGLYYVNIMPALVDGLKQGLHFSNREAGMVGSLNMYGGACGALLLALVVRRLNWRRWSGRLLLALVLLDLLSMAAHTPLTLMGVRFVHGVVGGALVGLSFSVFARTPAPDRTFGVLLLVQAGAGGLGVMVLPLLVPLVGTAVLFAALILFSAITLLLLRWLPDYPVRAEAADTTAPATVRSRPLLLSLFAVALFQAANMGLYAYLIGLGRSAGLSLDLVSGTLGVANWIAMLGAVMVVILSTRFGISGPIGGGMLLAVVGSWALLYSHVVWIWVLANVAAGVAWNFVIAYLLGMCARFGQRGSGAVWGGFASKVGLASGPMLGALVLGESQYGLLIWLMLALLVLAGAAAMFPAKNLDQAA